MRAWSGIPSLVVLLPAGFLAGVATDDVHPDNLLGALYQPFVSVAVGVILFEAGLRLSLEEVVPDVRKAMLRLVVGGVIVTWLAITATTALLYEGMDRAVAFVVGAILVVSGPTVVLPLLAFIRPTRSVRSLLKWEGTLIDPIGALLSVVVFTAIGSGQAGGRGQCCSISPSAPWWRSLAVPSSSSSCARHIEAHRASSSRPRSWSSSPSSSRRT